MRPRAWIIAMLLVLTLIAPVHSSPEPSEPGQVQSSPTMDSDWNRSSMSSMPTLADAQDCWTREVILLNDEPTRACGASTYNIVVARLSGSGFYWLDASTGGTIT